MSRAGSDELRGMSYEWGGGSEGGGNIKFQNTKLQRSSKQQTSRRWLMQSSLVLEDLLTGHELWGLKPDAAFGTIAHN
jgi:hypothetical protein